jgi:hypothetical protein
VGVGAVAYFGVGASFATASYQHSIWVKDKHMMQEVLSAAPRVTPGTVVVLTNFPKADDSFGDNMWFDFAVRLAYPRELVSGMYFFDDGTPATDENLALKSGFWSFTKTGYPPLIRRAPIANSVIIRYSATGAPRVLERVPRLLHPSAQDQKRYRPEARLGSYPPSDYAVRRYGPVPSLGVSENG